MGTILIQARASEASLSISRVRRGSWETQMQRTWEPVCPRPCMSPKDLTYSIVTKPTYSPTTMLLFPHLLKKFSIILTALSSYCLFLFFLKSSSKNCLYPSLCSLNPPPSQVPSNYCRVSGEWQSGSILLLIKPPSKMQLFLSVPGLGFLRACRTTKVLY